YYFKWNSVYYFIKGDFMDIDMLLTLIFGTVMFIFLIIAYLLYRQDQKIKNDCTDKTKGKVVKYSWQSSRAPFGEYMLNDVTYKKALYYSYNSHFHTPFLHLKYGLKIIY